MEEQASAPDFWNDQARAQKILQQRRRLENSISMAERFQRMLSDIEVLLEFASEDASSLDELRKTLDRLNDEVVEAETEMLFSGPHDSANAIVEINPGA